MKEILRKITEYFDGSMFCIGSDSNSSELVIRVTPYKHINDTNSKKSALPISYIGDHDDRYLRCIESFFLSDCNLKGLKNINKVFMSKSTKDPSKMRKRIKETGEMEKVSEWTLETEGTALLDILSQKYVDMKRTYSDDIWEIYAVSIYYLNKK